MGLRMMITGSVQPLETVGSGTVLLFIALSRHLCSNNVQLQKRGGGYFWASSLQTDAENLWERCSVLV